MFYYTVGNVVVSPGREAISHETGECLRQARYEFPGENRPPSNDMPVKLSRDDNLRHPCYLLVGSLAVLVGRL